MNVPFVTFQCRDLKVFSRIVYLQANRDFQKVITQARKNIFSCGFLQLVHLNELFHLTILENIILRKQLIQKVHQPDQFFV